MEIIAKDISKNFKLRKGFNILNKKVLENVNLSLSEGDIIGLVGPNGSGKSTLLKIILGLIEPDSGYILKPTSNNFYSAYINTNQRSFFWRLSARDNLNFFGKLMNLKQTELNIKIEELSESFDVAENLDKPFMTLSSGQMQSFNAVRAFLKTPDFLLLDEPCTSLDPKFSDNLKNILLTQIKRNQTPTIWCSHDHNEILETCTEYKLLINNTLNQIDKKFLDTHKTLAKNYIFEIARHEYAKLEKLYKTEVLAKNSENLYVYPLDTKLLVKKFIKDVSRNDIDIISFENNRINFFDSIK